MYERTLIITKERNKTPKKKYKKIKNRIERNRMENSYITKLKSDTPIHLFDVRVPATAPRFIVRSLGRLKHTELQTPRPPPRGESRSQRQWTYFGLPFFFFVIIIHSIITITIIIISYTLLLVFLFFIFMIDKAGWCKCDDLHPPPCKARTYLPPCINV